MSDLGDPPGSNFAGEDVKSYRIVAMLPTEVHVQADDIEGAEVIAEFYIEKYPQIDHPIGSVHGNRSKAGAKILSVEEL